MTASTQAWTRRRAARVLFISIVALVAFPLPVAADLIVKSDGTRIEGTVLAEEADRVQIRAKVGKSEGTFWIPRKDIYSIEKGPLLIDEFQTRLAALDPADLKAHQDLMAWAKQKQLPSGVQAIEERLPEVERLGRIRQFPRTWCRTCESRGMSQCADCDGQGKLKEKCVRCTGEGKIRCRSCGRREDAGVLRCAKCSGQGQVEQFDPAKGSKEKVNCPQCRGKGTTPCPSCGGKGAMACPACSGSGGIEKACTKCNGKPKFTCPTCSGKGVQAKALTDEELARETAERAARGGDSVPKKGAPPTGPAADPKAPTDPKDPQDPKDGGSTPPATGDSPKMARGAPLADGPPRVSAWFLRAPER